MEKLYDTLREYISVRNSADAEINEIVNKVGVSIILQTRFSEYYKIQKRKEVSRMSKRYTDEYKNTIVELYNSGKTLAELNSEYGLPKSTILTWVNKAKPIAIDDNKIITQADYQAILKKMALIEEENEILKKAMAIFAKK